MGRSPIRRHNDRPLYSVRDARTHHSSRRSRSPDRRPRDDRNNHRYDDGRSSYRDDRHRSPRRHHAQDRDADYRHRSPRARDSHRLRDDSRDRGTKRPNRDRSPARHTHSSSRDDSDPKRLRRQSPTPPRLTEEDIARQKQEARQNKVEEWKRKQLAKKSIEDPASTAATSPAPSTPTAVATPSATLSPAPTDRDAASLYNLEALDRPGVKFDAKSFLANRGKAKEKKPKVLGGDVVIPDAVRKMGAAPVRKSTLNGATNQKISGFGLSNAPTDRSSKLSNVMLDDQEEVSRKLEKLPDMPMIESEDLEDHEEQDEVGIQSDEEEAAEIREALRKRATEAEEKTAGVDPDAMEDDAPSADIKSEVKTDDAVMQDDEDEVDPLDAFMSTLEVPVVTASAPRTEQQLFDGADDVELDAVGDDVVNLDAAVAAAKKKKKELPKIDHGKVQYEPFRKNFYTEPEELADMTAEEVAELRQSLDNISVTPENAPKPIQKFSHGGFGTQILEVIRQMKYESTTPIQAQALPAIMSGRDVIGIAKTGSGKTVAYILPMFRHIKDQRPIENLEGPIALILAPTRELATQIFRDCRPYAKALGLRGVCAYGGAQISDQIADCKRGADFVVCTPGRMIDLLAANSGRVTNLRRVTYVVLDEADRMFDLGFEPQITKILNNVRPDRQTVLFSATFRASMEALAHKTLRKPIQINVGGRSVVAETITQVIEVREEGTKFNRLLELLGEVHGADGDERSLVFVERQESADSIYKDLLRRGYPSVSIHGGREQIDRDQALSDFKAGIFPVMVATSVAARGLDVKQLKLVVNYDSPNHLEDYVHRCGRTGRAGNTGTAVTFVTPQQDRFAKFLTQALTDAGREVPSELSALQAAHEEKLKSGQAKNFKSGFGGRGIDRLDAARDAERARQQKQHKPMDGDDEEEESEDEEASKEKSEKDRTVEEMVKKAASGVSAFDAKPAEPTREPAQPQQVMPSALNDKLNNAMKVQKAEVVAAAPSATVKPAGSDAVSKAAAIANSINSRLGGNKNQNRPGAPAENRGPDAGAFHAILEINDFPQKARWSVTNRTNVAKILEATGTSITTKGNFYAPGSEPEPGAQPKLYILVEGDTELVVEAAMRELTKLLREGTYAALEEESKKATGGRYSVV